MFRKSKNSHSFKHAIKKVFGSFMLNRRSVFGWAAFCTALAAALALSSTCVCYAVSIDGTSVGRAVTRSELVQAVETAEKQASEILGRECSLSEAVTVTADIGTDGQSVDELAAVLLANVDGIERKCAVVLDGEPVGALAGEDALTAILDAILDSYSDPNTVYAGFKQDVEIKYMFVSEELPDTPGEIARMLSPDNDDSEFSLTVVTSDETESVETVPHDIAYIYDEEKYSDESETLTEGVDGLKTVTTVTEYENGQAVSSVTAKETVIREPVTERICVGAIPGSRTDSTGGYIMPADAPISSYYGPRNVTVGSSFHKGIDLDGDTGDDVWAADGGEVIMAESYYGYGLLVQVLHDNGDITYYAHISEILVSVGDRVAQGDTLGLMGMTGTASGSHLHFEIRPGGGEPVDPMKYLSEE